jgi:UDP-N-acetylglucosamine acyltransferase
VEQDCLIHPSAIVHPQAQLDSTVRVGPYAVVGPKLRIGAHTTVGPHCVLEGDTEIGCHNQIFQFASLGAQPQDKKYAGEPTQLIIGDRNTIREFWIMAYVHIAHDCVVGHNTILANNATLAGHVHVGDWVILGGLTGVHQFTRIGAHAMAGFASHISQDVPPFMMVDGNPLAVRGFNIEGLRRRGFGEQRLRAVKQMHRLLYRQGLTLEAARAAIAALAAELPEAAADVQAMLDFLAASQRGIAR